MFFVGYVGKQTGVSGQAARSKNKAKFLEKPSFLKYILNNMEYGSDRIKGKTVKINAGGFY